MTLIQEATEIMKKLPQSSQEAVLNLLRVMSYRPVINEIDDAELNGEDFYGPFDNVSDLMKSLNE